MNSKEFLQSHTVTAILVALVFLVLLAGAFSVGESIGYRKASFAFQNGNNFYQTFGPRPDHTMLSLTDLPDAHGSVGKVVSITLPTITIEDNDNTEKIVVVNDQTVIRQLRDTVTAQDIAVGDDVIVIGQPDTQSHIVANLIRILPPAPQSVQQ